MQPKTQKNKKKTKKKICLPQWSFVVNTYIVICKFTHKKRQATHAHMLTHTHKTTQSNKINVTKKCQKKKKTRERNRGQERLDVLVKQYLKHEDYNLRYNVLQLVTTFLMAKGASVRQTLMNIAGAPNIFCELLEDDGLVRNQALLLLIELTKNDTNIQQLIGFLAFHKILLIAKEEGGIEDDNIVVDCIELLKLLIDQNPINQKLFIEGGNIPNLIEFLIPKDYNS